MIPNINVLTTPIEEVRYQSRTYKADVEHDRLNGYTDGLDAVIQAIYFILNTERYRFPIYSWDYGFEVLDLFGKPMPYVMAELPRRIEDALLTDDRILEVRNFEFESERSKLHTKFEVVTQYGTATIEKTWTETLEPKASDSTVARLHDGTLYFNVPAFNTDNTLLLNRLPVLDENGTLIFD